MGQPRMISQEITPVASASALDLCAVGMSYPSGEGLRPVLSNITLTIEPGSFVSIVGASGCGKSTLLRLIIGLESDYQGEILLDGDRIHGPGADRGIVFQDHRLFPWLTVEDNIRLGLEAGGVTAAEQRRIVAEHIALVRLTGHERAYPHQLSGGMAQRAAIARALVGRPRLLLLDEPLGALDQLTRTYLQDELLRIWQEEAITMIMVTHDVEEAVYLSDRIVVLEPNPGRVRATVPIDLPRPRDRGEVAFGAVKRQVLGLLKD